MDRNVVLYIASSLDGFIARKNGDIDWLPNEGDEDFGYKDFYKTIDTIVMGRTTYNQIINELSPGAWVYKGKECYVATTKEYQEDKNVTFFSKGISCLINKLKNEQGKDIWLVGGGKLIDQFIKQNLIDKYIITIIPTVLGEGVPLFLKENPEIKLNLINAKTYDDVVELKYKRHLLD